MGVDRAQSFLVTHHGRLYDIGPFLERHPGGIRHVEPYRGRSVTSLLLKGHSNESDAGSTLVHSEAARYILQDYRLHDNPTKQGKEGSKANGLNGHKNGLNGISNKNGINKQNGMTNKEEIFEEEEIENLEKLVDWDKPMLGQVASLGPKYTKWVNLPVDRKLRLFGHPLLETLSKSKWYFVPIVWIPVMYWFLTLHFNGGNSETLAAMGILLGIINWTIVEYTLHRWLFHLPPGESKFLITMHFLIHGLHHKVPYDGTRLVFPPAPAGILGVILYSIFWVILPSCILNSVAAGTTIGYIGYDLFHYYLHFGRPKPNSHLYYMKRYHNQHHFVHHDSGYGITSSFWDIIFGTKIMLQKLAKHIKW